MLFEKTEVPAERFALSGEPAELRPEGQGIINRTFYLRCTGGEYLIQRINTDVFPDADGLMRNIRLVTGHIREKLRQEGGDLRGCLEVIPTTDGADLAHTEGGCWRCYRYIGGTYSLQSAASCEEFRQAALAFGQFQNQLADFPASTLCEVIPDFHHTPKRLKALWAAAEADVCGRAASVERELEFVRRREAFAAVLTDAAASGDLPLRVTHNDTKLNNLLFDNVTRKPLAVVDLDTVMPGTSLADFGDAIRFGASTAAEDETDLEKVACDLGLFGAFTDGWLTACGQTMTKTERELLPQSPRVLTLECGARFLTDYLNGDTYFKTSRPGQNLDRCRASFRLVKDMEEKEREMREITEKR